jgi:hypothetical protein
VAIVVVAALGASAAAATGFRTGKNHPTGHTGKHHASPGGATAAHPLVQRVLLAAASPWRTGWALSLDHPGQLTGPRLTCRLVARISMGGTQVRFRLVNYPSRTPVTFSILVAAVRTTGLDVDAATQREVTVKESAAVTLAPNGEVMTDPVDLPVQRGQDVTLSIAVGSGVSAPWHYWTSQSNGCTSAGVGDTSRSVTGVSFGEWSEDRWLSEVQVLPASPVPTIAVYGDSLTDGLYLPVDTGARWTDRLEAETDGRVVALNYGVAGDRITGQAPEGQLPSRVATDVLAPAGLSAVIVEMGSNDIKAGVSAAEILAQYRLIAARLARAHETLIVATVPARRDGLSAPEEHQRRLLNAGCARTRSSPTSTPRSPIPRQAGSG